MQSSRVEPIRSWQLLKKYIQRYKCIDARAGQALSNSYTVSGNTIKSIEMIGIFFIKQILHAKLQ